MPAAVSFRGTNDHITFANNTSAPLTAADVGKPVKRNDITKGDVVLCADGDVILGVVTVVDASGVGVQCGGVVECNPKPDDDITVNAVYAVADGNGGVKKSATFTNARVLQYANGKVYLRLS